MGAKFDPPMRTVTDLDAESADPNLPPWIARPKNAPAYHGFPLLEGSECEGFAFGVITSPEADAGSEDSVSYVVAPDGSRAGIVWCADGEPDPVVLPPSDGRWGVYAFRFLHPVRNRHDLIRNLHEVLPQLKEYFEAARISHPESTNSGVPRDG
jgi:hypothetical protein